MNTDIKEVSSINYDTNSVSRRMHDAKLKLGITDQKIHEKFCFAFFLDHFKGDPRIPESEFQSLARHQWFPGSLTREHFEGLIGGFLQHEMSHALHPNTRNVLQDFLKLGGLELSQEIDLARKNDLRLILLAQTGAPLFFYLPGLPIRSDVSNELSQNIVNQIRELKEGEGILVLVGDLCHDTQLLIRYAGNQVWILHYFDSGGPSPISKLECYAETIFDSKLWTLLFEQKFRENSRIDLEKALLNFGASRERDSIKSFRTLQLKNTCHFRGLAGVLKYLVCHAFPGMEDSALKEWSLFKERFGRFILEHTTLACLPLKRCCVLKQECRTRKQTLLKQIADQVDAGNYEAIVLSYKRIFSALGVTYFSEREGDSQEQHLTTLHRNLLRRLADWPIEPQGLSYLFEDAHPFIKRAHSDFLIEFLIRREFQAKDLEILFQSAHSSQFKAVIDSNFSPWIDRMIDASKKIEMIFGLCFDGKTQVQPYAPLESDPLSHYLTILLKNSDWAVNHLHIPQIKGILNQALQEGKFQEVKCILHHAGPRKIEEFCYSIELNPWLMKPGTIESICADPSEPLAQALAVKFVRFWLTTQSPFELFKLEQRFPEAIGGYACFHKWKLPKDVSLKQYVQDFIRYWNCEKESMESSAIFGRMVADLYSACLKDGDEESLKLLQESGLSCPGMPILKLKD